MKDTLQGTRAKIHKQNQKNQHEPTLFWNGFRKMCIFLMLGSRASEKTPLQVRILACNPAYPQTPIQRNYA